MTDPWDKPFDGSIFDDSYETSKIVAAAEGMSIPEYPWNHPAVEFAKWYIDVFGHGPKGSQSWIDHGADYRVAKDFAEVGADDTTGVENDDSVLDDYADVTASTGTGTETTPGGPANNETIEEITGTGTDDVDTARRRAVLENLGVDTTGMLAQEIEQALNDIYDNQSIASTDDAIDEITVVEKFPENPIEGMQVIKDGIKYVWSLWGIGDGWEAVSDESPGTPADNETIEEITVTGTPPESGGLGGLGSGILALLGGIPGLSEVLGLGGDDGDDWFKKLFELFKTKKAIDEANKYKVPTGQMDAQSAIGKQWGLPSKESMVMQGLGPNILQGQKYAMPKGTTMPAATHVSGMPLLEEIEGGNQGGIMGLKSHGDITPAFLEPGEFVFTKKATDNIGAKRLYKLMKQAEQMGIG